MGDVERRTRAQYEAVWKYIHPGTKERKARYASATGNSAPKANVVKQLGISSSDTLNIIQDIEQRREES